MLFGNKIKELRDEQGVLQRQLAALLEIDTPMFSKIERGDRKAKRDQVVKLAEYFHQDEKKMLTLWLADKFIDAVKDVQDRELCVDAIALAQEEIMAQYLLIIDLFLSSVKWYTDYTIIYVTYRITCLSILA